jgi:hypothetical protein
MSRRSARASRKSSDQKKEVRKNGCQEEGKGGKEGGKEGREEDRQEEGAKVVGAWPGFDASPGLFFPFRERSVRPILNAALRAGPAEPQHHRRTTYKKEA